jgi:hypothetical protein
MPAHLLTFSVKDAQDFIEIDLLAHHSLGPQSDTVISYKWFWLLTHQEPG